MDGKSFVTANPRSYAFVPGKYSILVQAKTPEAEIVWKKVVTVSVSQLKKTKSATASKSTKNTKTAS